MPRATAGSRVTLPCSTATAWHSPAVAQVCKPAARLTLHAGHRYTGAQGRCCRGGLFDTLSLAVRSNYRPMADASHGPCFSNSWKCCVLVKRCPMCGSLSPCSLGPHYLLARFIHRSVVLLTSSMSSGPPPIFFWARPIR